MLSKHPKRTFTIGLSLLRFCLTSSVYLAFTLVLIGFLSYFSIITHTMRQQYANIDRRKTYSPLPKTQDSPKPKNMMRFSPKRTSANTKGHLQPLPKASATKSPARVKI
ncbi:MAG TPA: hypothetical protein PLD88_12910 [Candidatus Berkiella sp.]|nr:hypothetical protein [Candidatus Berkiella sp.]